MMIARKKSIFAAEHSTAGKRLPPVAIRHLEHGSTGGTYVNGAAGATYVDMSAVLYRTDNGQILYRSEHGSYRDIRLELAKQAKADARINRYLLWGALALVAIVALWWAM